MGGGGAGLAALREALLTEGVYGRLDGHGAGAGWRVGRGGRVAAGCLFARVGDFLVLLWAAVFVLRWLQALFSHDAIHSMLLPLTLSLACRQCCQPLDSCHGA